MAAETLSHIKAGGVLEYTSAPQDLEKIKTIKKASRIEQIKAIEEPDVRARLLFAETPFGNSLFMVYSAIHAPNVDYSSRGIYSNILSGLLTEAEEKGIIIPQGFEESAKQIHTYSART